MKRVLFFISLTALLSSCDEITEPQSSGTSGEWLVPSNQVYDGGPGKDGIPALSNPDFVPTTSAGFLLDEDLIVGVRVGNEVKGYPHRILNWHEIANDRIGNLELAVTYCPLTGSALGWNRDLDGTTTTFGVSGLLYNSNLIPYDRLTNSNWSQMGNQCINGELIGRLPDNYPVIETTWKTWKKLFPDSEVLSTNTGFSRNYDIYPYGDYNINHDYFLFDVPFWDRTIESKVRVLGIEIGGKALAFQIEKFGSGVSLIKYNFDGENIVVAGSSGDNFAAAFYPRSGSTALQLSAVTGEYPVIMEDTDGNKWDIFGYAVSGPLKGRKLDKPGISYTAFWFAWSAFHELTVVGN